MPRLKASKGRVVFKTPFPEELQRYMFYELANAKEWNPDTIHVDLQQRGWIASGPQWRIEWTGTELIVVSILPYIDIRHGLSIGMGHGRIIIHSIGAP